LCFLEFLIKLIEHLKTLQKDEYTESYENKSDTTPYLISQALGKFIMELLGQSNLEEINRQIRTNNKSHIQQKIIMVRIGIADRNYRYQPKQYNTYIQDIEKETVQEGFQIVLTDHLLLASQVHFGPGNNHIYRIDEYNKSCYPVKSRMLIDDLHQIPTCKISGANTYYISNKHPKIERKGMPRTPGETGFNKQEKYRPDKYQTQHYSKTYC